jgi:hypothetical protein
VQLLARHDMLPAFPHLTTSALKTTSVGILLYHTQHVICQTHCTLRSIGVPYYVERDLVPHTYCLPRSATETPSPFYAPTHHSEAPNSPPALAQPPLHMLPCHTTGFASRCMAGHRVALRLRPAGAVLRRDVPSVGQVKLTSPWCCCQRPAQQAQHHQAPQTGPGARAL